MKRFFATLLLLSLAGAVLYYLGIGLGIGPFDSGAAKGQPTQRRGGGGRSVTVKTEAVRVADVEAKLSYVGSLAAKAAVTIAPKTSGRVATLL